MEALPKHSAALIITSYIRSVPTRRADKKRDAMISFMFKYEKMGEHAERVTRFMRYAAGVKQGRIEKGNMTARLFAMDRCVTSATTSPLTLQPACCRRSASCTRGFARGADAGECDKCHSTGIMRWTVARVPSPPPCHRTHAFACRSHQSLWFGSTQTKKKRTMRRRRSSLSKGSMRASVYDNSGDLEIEVGEDRRTRANADGGAATGSMLLHSNQTPMAN